MLFIIVCFYYLFINLFQINETSGEIFLKENRNFFDQFYEIFIEAFYLNYLSSLTTVQIYFNLTNSNFQNQQNFFIEILIPKLFQRQYNYKVFHKVIRILC